MPFLSSSTISAAYSGLLVTKSYLLLSVDLYTTSYGVVSQEQGATNTRSQGVLSERTLKFVGCFRGTLQPTTLLK